MHGPRLRQRGAGRDRARADVAAVLHAPVRRAQPRAGHRAGREDQGHLARARLQGVLHQLGLGGQRHADQDRLVLQQRARPAQAQEDHRPPARLSRHHRCGGQPLGARRVPCRFRSADRGRAAHRLPAPLEIRRSRRKRGGLRQPRRPQPRGPDRARGAGHDRRLHRRAGDGRGRRAHSARHLLREGAGRAGQARHRLHRRRGDLRLWPHRQLVGLADVRHAAVDRHHGQGRSPRPTCRWAR